jgi:integrase
MASPDYDWCRQLEGSYADRVRGSVDRLDAAHERGEITDDDHRLIHDLLEYEAMAEGKANTTLQNRTQSLYKTAERGETPLTEHDPESIQRLLEAFKSGRHDDVKNGGIGVSNYQKALRVFYRRHDHLGIDPDAIDIDKDHGKDLRPEDLLYRDEVDAILQQTRDLRDRALFALILATGQRNDAVRTLRMEHVELDDRTMTIRLNDTEGATKGASGTVPLLWAKHYVREWVDHHPYQDDQKAALFPPAKGAVPEEKRRDPMNSDGVTKAIRRMADRGDGEKDRHGTTPHLLRAAAITRMAAKGVSEQRMKQIVGWSRDSSQFDTYVALANDINNDRIREEMGYATSNDDPPVIGRPTLETCPNTGCGDTIPDGRDTCPTCGFDLSAPADTEDPTPDTDSVNQVAAALRQAIEEHGEAQAGDILYDAMEEVAETLDE